MDYLVEIDNDGTGPGRQAVLSAWLPTGLLTGVQAVVLDLNHRCTRRGRSISCALGTIAAQAFNEVVIQMQAPRGTYVLRAHASTQDHDFYLGNNKAQATLRVP
jgi:crotonobetainyl-CoA:carnitine CoA-transferase CaiB-like acyl-CoA transferase